MSAKARSRPTPTATRRAAPRPPIVPASAWPWLAASVLVLCVLVVYSRAFTCGYIWDDDYYVTHNDTLRSLDGLRRIWCEPGAVPQYYPLVHTTFWVEYHLWGLRATGYHVINALLHAAAAVLLWRLLARLHVPGAWFAAALFAVHPVEVESVAWITERKNVLSAVMALCSLLAYLRFAPADAGDAPRDVTEPSSNGKWKWYALSLVLFIAALLSKTVTVSAPAVLLVIYWWKRGRITWRDVAPLIPFFAVGLALAAVTIYMEKHVVGAQGAEWNNLSFVGRILIAGRALWFYAATIVWPSDPNFFYPRWTIDPRQAWQYIYPIFAVAVIVGLWMARHRIGRGPCAAVLIFAGVLVPALGFFDVYPFRYSFVADHFQYHASMALIALLAAIAAIASRRLEGGLGPLSTGAAAIVLAVLGSMAFQRTVVYEDEVTLFESVVAADPQSWIGHHNLGLQRLHQGNVRDALKLLNRAVELDPKNLDAYPSLATALSAAGDDRRAITVLEQALAAPEADAGLRARVMNNLAMTLVTARDNKLRDPQRAVELAEEATRAAPQMATFHGTLGTAYYRANRIDKAIPALEKAIKLGDEDGGGSDRFMLALSLAKVGRLTEARQMYDEGDTWRAAHPGADPEAADFAVEAAALLGIAP